MKGLNKISSAIKNLFKSNIVIKSRRPGLSVIDMRRLKSMLLAALSIQAIGSLAATPISSPNHSSCLSNLVYRPSKGVQTKSKRNRISQKKRRLNHRRKGK